MMDQYYAIDDEDIVLTSNSSFSDVDDTFFLENTNETVIKCAEEEVGSYQSTLGVTLAVPEWEAVLTAITLTAIILLTVVGNILVILSVFTYKPLRIVQNFFIVSLAVADLTVAVLVLPFNVAYSILGRWVFGIHVCKMWLTCDVLCCTASILNLCAIALDRYWAITDPINYAQKRTVKRVLLMIGGVWVLSAVISSPPLIGWNDWPEVFKNTTPCMLTQQQGYVIYSSLGSFFIPLFIMTIVYVEIFIATRRRLRERAKASKLNAVRQVNTAQQHQVIVSKPEHHDNDSVSSETNHNDQEATNYKHEKKKEGRRKKRKKNNTKQETFKTLLVQPNLAEDSVTDNQDMSSGSQKGNNCVMDNHTTVTNVTGESPILHQKDKTRDEPAQTSNLLPNKKPVQVSQFIEEKQRISLSKERRAARTLGIIMGVFVVCWLPFFLMYVIAPFCPSCCISAKFTNFITWLGYINSALNPIIYTIFNLDFRKAFKKLLRIKT